MYLKKLAEQIIRRHESGAQPMDSRLDIREVYILIKQVINRLIKVEHIDVNMALAELVPPNASLATYTVSVSQPDAISYTAESCTSFGNFGQASAPWLDNESVSWTTEEWEEWLISNLTGDVSIARDGYDFHVRAEGIRYPYGKTPAQLELFFSQGDENSYFEFTDALWSPDPTWVNALASWWSTAGGESWVTAGDPALSGNQLPYRYGKVGISNFRAWEDGFEFDYNIDGSNNSCSGLQDKLLESHALLLALTDGITTSYDGAYFVSVKRCDVECMDNSQNAEVSLPAQPIALPRGMGVWRVYNPANPLSLYVPVQAGEYGIAGGVSHTNLAGILDGLICYEWHSHNTLVFNKPASQLPSQVNVQLVIVNPNVIDEFEVLPIPAEMQITVIEEVLKLLAPFQPADNATNQNDSR